MSPPRSRRVDRRHLVLLDIVASQDEAMRIAALFASISTPAPTARGPRSGVQGACRLDQSAGKRRDLSMDSPTHAGVLGASR